MISLPLFPTLFLEGLSRTCPAALSSDPNLEADPSPALFLSLLTSSDHSNHFGDLIMYIDKCKL